MHVHCTTSCNIHCSFKWKDFCSEQKRLTLLNIQLDNERLWKDFCSEQRRLTLLNIQLDNERLVLEKENLMVEIEVLRETKEVMQLKKNVDIFYDAACQDFKKKYYVRLRDTTTENERNLHQLASLCNMSWQ